MACHENAKPNLTFIVRRVDSWRMSAACLGVNSELFFLTTAGHPAKAAQALCAGCPVKSPCLEYALAEGINLGIWGGTSPRTRQRIRKQRRIAAAA